MQARRGPQVPHYNLALDVGRVYRFEVANVLLDDGLTVLKPSGGTSGSWLEVRRVLDGANLTDADINVLVGGNVLRVLPAATLTATHFALLGTTNAERGDVIRIVRNDLSVFVYNVVNGGPASGILHAFAGSVAGFADSYFDGTDWIRMAFGSD
jgi:hypothetical protein